MKIGPSISTICGISFLLFLGHLLSPWVNELSGEDKIIEKARIDVESCDSYTPIYIDGVLFCQCSDKESQKPNKCNEKYK